jgi:hypothetical protein
VPQWLISKLFFISLLPSGTYERNVGVRYLYVSKAEYRPTEASHIHYESNPMTCTFVTMVHRFVYIYIYIDLSVPHRKHNISPLRAQQVNAIYRFVTMVYQYNYHNSGHYPSSCLLFKTKLSSTGLSVPHRKHITSPLQTKQVNAIYRFAIMVY